MKENEILTGPEKSDPERYVAPSGRKSSQINIKPTLPQYGSSRGRGNREERM